MLKISKNNEPQQLAARWWCSRLSNSRQHSRYNASRYGHISAIYFSARYINVRLGWINKSNAGPARSMWLMVCFGLNIAGIDVKEDQNYVNIPCVTVEIQKTVSVTWCRWWLVQGARWYFLAMKKCYVSVLISVVKLSFNLAPLSKVVWWIAKYRLILCQQQRQNKWCKRSIG